jgi:hypothetical protein
MPLVYDTVGSVSVIYLIKMPMYQARNTERLSEKNSATEPRMIWVLKVLIRTLLRM